MLSLMLVIAPSYWKEKKIDIRKEFDIKTTQVK